MISNKATKGGTTTSKGSPTRLCTATDANGPEQKGHANEEAKNLPAPVLRRGEGRDDLSHSSSHLVALFQRYVAEVRVPSSWKTTETTE